MRLAILTVAALAQLVPAQEPERADALAASRPRLEKALQKTAGLTDTAFAAEWGPHGKQDGNDDPVAAFLMATGRGKQKVTGSWHARHGHYAFDGDAGDELLVAGRRMLARSDADGWTLRAGRYADGSDLAFVPDIELLLTQLGSWQMAMTHREVGSLDDKPVEIITVTLNDDQVADAVWSGMLPSALVSGFAGNVFRIALGGRGGGRQAAPKPDAIVDLAITLDPATSLVHQLKFRVYTKADQGFGRNVVIQRVGGGAVVAEEKEEAEEEEAEGEPGAPLQFIDGLPKRSRKKQSVSDYTIRLRQHGEAAGPALTDEQKKLLRL